MVEVRINVNFQYLTKPFRCISKLGLLVRASLTNYKCSNKSGYCCKSESNFFRDPVLYQVGIGCDSSRDFSSTEFVKEPNVLLHACFQILLSNLSTYVFTGIWKIVSALALKRGSSYSQMNPTVDM